MLGEFETNAKLETDVPSVAIKADRSQFVRLIQNMVSNAIKYRKLGRNANIAITAASADDSTVQAGNRRLRHRLRGEMRTNDLRAL